MYDTVSTASNADTRIVQVVDINGIENITQLGGMSCYLGMDSANESRRYYVTM